MLLPTPVVTQTALTGDADDPRALIVIFLRGAADGLTLVPPLLDDDYHRARPRLRVSPREALMLDGFFGLHPLLAPLHSLYTNGTLAIVHAAGSEDTTRSHFEAQDLMEHGGVTAGGWLGRFLRYRPRARHGALSAIAVGRELPLSLRGAPAATAMQSIDEFSLGNDRMAGALALLYGGERDMIGEAGRETLAALARIEKLRGTLYVPDHGATYARDDFAQGLMQLARLLKARVGLEAASIDVGGWDSHFTQGAVIDPLMVKLGGGLAAFARDMGAQMATTTVVVMTEFGRRVAENASFGTDHGRGSVMFVMGGGVHGGRVLGSWPGLTGSTLEGPGDLPVTTNYRQVLAPILERHASRGALEKIFPGMIIEPLGVYG